MCSIESCIMRRAIGKPKSVCPPSPPCHHRHRTPIVEARTRKWSTCAKLSSCFSDVNGQFRCHACRYIHNVLVDISTEVFVFIFIYLTLASKSIADLGELGSMLAAEWLLRAQHKVNVVALSIIIMAPEVSVASSREGNVAPPQTNLGPSVRKYPRDPPKQM